MQLLVSTCYFVCMVLMERWRRALVLVLVPVAECLRSFVWLLFGLMWWHARASPLPY